jgi:tetratricopeptide (TPR) repeat protein
LNYLGYILADKGQRLEEARVMIEKALDKHPDNGSFLDSLGWVYFRSGQSEKAREYIEKALQLIETESATLYDHLGDVLNDIGKSQNAIQQWERALELDDPDATPKQIENIRKKIQDANPMP